jgi:TBC domain-containing protein kinase-like protein
LQQFRKRSEKQLGLISFLARLYPNDKCGSNGLPLTPNSIRIYGKFQYLKTLKNKYLCRYVDIQRGNNERVFVIGENFSLNLNHLLNDTYIYNLIISNTSILVKWVHQLLKAFVYLNNHMLTSRFLHLKYICVTPQGNLKLSNYGLFYMTEYGYCVDFPIVNYVTLAPECYLLEKFYDCKHADTQASNDELANIELNYPKSDVWSLGVLLFQFIFGLSSQTQSSQQHLSQLLSAERIINCTIDLFSRLERGELSDSDDEANIMGYQHMLTIYDIDAVRRAAVEAKTKPIFISLIKKCLTLNPAKRPDFKELLKFYVANVPELKMVSPGGGGGGEDESIESSRFNLFSQQVRSDYLSDNKIETDQEEEDHLWRRGVDEVYYLWKLAAGDCLQTLKQNGRLTTKLMPIHKLNIYTTVEDGCEHGKQVNDEILFDDTIVPLSLQQLRDKLAVLKVDAYYPLIENGLEGSDEKRKTSASLLSTQHLAIDLTQPNNRGSNGTDTQDIEKQPLNIKEGDLVYQFHRLVIFARYLSGYPFKKNELYKECRVDIPPLYRSLAWAALLDVDSDIQQVYWKVNKEVVTSTDRQIDVDIPRCHQYDYLMASPQAHIKLKRLLKAWVIANPNLVYWQGLDSLCAPFLYLHFNAEHLAFGCLTNFVNKYAANFFLKDNSAVIHEYLAVFQHLIAFHDPQLAVHFDLIEFKPDLYAIPWFLTMFAHILPLYKIFHLWDTLLLGTSSFPLCIGVAILKQLRAILLGSDFNECILLFSELPEINMAKCVSDSLEIFCHTPASCMYREHAVNGEARKRSKPTPTPPLTQLDMTPINLEQMRCELGPRISARDVMALTASDSSLKACLIDLRSGVEFQQVNVLPMSKNVPFENINFNKLDVLVNNQTQILTANENDSTAFLLYLLQTSKNDVKVLLASEAKLNNAVELANVLVRHTFSRVCVLNRGIECLVP